MGKKIDWSKIGEIVEKIREHKLTYKDGAEQFGVKVGSIYEYNRGIKKKKCTSKQKKEEANERESLSIKLSEGAEASFVSRFTLYT